MIKQVFILLKSIKDTKYQYPISLGEIAEKSFVQHRGKTYRYDRIIGKDVIFVEIDPNSIFVIPQEE